MAGRRGLLARRRRLELLEAELEWRLERVREQLETLKAAGLAQESPYYYGLRGGYAAPPRRGRAPVSQPTEEGDQQAGAGHSQQQQGRDEDLESLTKRQLIEQARESGVSVRANMTKAEIIEALRRS